MIEADARALLEDQTQWQTDPALTSDEIDRLLLRSRITDENGAVVDTDDYVDTWSQTSINRATAQGWRMKAAKIAGKYDVSAGEGTSFKRSQAFEMCLTMARRWSGSGISSIQLRGSYAGRS